MINLTDDNIYKELELLPPDFQGFNKANSNFFDELISKIKPKTIMEIGSWKGASAFTMCKSIKKNKLNTKIFCIDTWLGAIEFIDKTRGWLTNENFIKERNLVKKNGYPQVYYQFLSNVVHSENQDIIIPFPNTSLIASRYFKHNGIKADLVYIDGSHDYFDVYHDILNYSELLLENGLIFGDDYHWADVKKAVIDFASLKNKKIEIYENNFWVLK